MKMVNKAALQLSVHSQINHELLTPLTGILGMAHFLSNTSLTIHQKKLLDAIVTSAHELEGAGEKIRIILKNNKI